MTGINCWKNSVALQKQISEITDSDIQEATFRLGKDPAYKKHTQSRYEKDTPDTAEELTGRQARLVLYYKVYHFFWGKKPEDEDRERKKICQCVEAMVRDAHPDDDDDQLVLQKRQQGGADYSFSTYNYNELNEWTYP